MYKGTVVVHGCWNSTGAQVYKSITLVQMYSRRSIMHSYKYCKRVHRYRSSTEVHCLQE